VHQHDIASVVMFVIDNLGVDTIELKCDTPIATNSD